MTVEVIEMQPGQMPPPSDEPYLLVTALPDADGTNMIPGARGTTHTVPTKDLEFWISVFREKAAEKGLSKVYVQRAPDA